MNDFDSRTKQKHRSPSTAQETICHHVSYMPMSVGGDLAIDNEANQRNS